MIRERTMKLRFEINYDFFFHDRIVFLMQTRYYKIRNKYREVIDMRFKLFDDSLKSQLLSLKNDVFK